MITNTGIKTICKIIPGTAFNTAPAKKVPMPNFETSKPIQQNIAAPHIKRPLIIALINDIYTFILLFFNLTYNHPDTKPYAANSNAIQNAVGNIGGIPNVKERKIGAINPTVSPQGAPQKNPHNNTGICIGHNIEPICGICPVKNGITKANAKNKAAKVIFFISFLLILNSPSTLKKGALFPILRKSNTFWYCSHFLIVIYIIKSFCPFYRLPDDKHIVSSNFIFIKLFFTMIYIHNKISYLFILL